MVELVAAELKAVGTIAAANEEEEEDRKARGEDLDFCLGQGLGAEAMTSLLFRRI